MSKPQTVKTYLEKTILKHSVIGFVVLAIISLIVTFFLARYKMASDLQEMAKASSKSFRSEILDGNIRAVEAQMHDVLQLQAKEQAIVLNRDYQRIYKPNQEDMEPLQQCQFVGITCFDGYLGAAQVFLPIYFDREETSLFGYLYLSKKIHIDWIYVTIVFLIFATGYIALMFGLTNITKRSLQKLGSEIEVWSNRLKQNPKDSTPLAEAPFSELDPLKKAIEGLNSQIKEFENKASHKAKLLLLRGIAHDLLGPVGQLQMYLATLEKKIHGQNESHETFEDIKDSLKKVTMVASQVKFLNEIGQKNDPTDLTAIAESEVKFLQNSKEIQTKSIKLDFISPKAKEIITFLSKAEISRMLQNLVQNAAQASPEKTTITVEVGQNNNQAFLQVADQGPGIPMHLREKVFEPEFTTKPGTGTGLGLSIVRHICVQRNGKVDLICGPNHGTTVTMIVPAVNFQGVANDL